MTKHIAPKRLLLYSFLIWVLAYAFIPAKYVGNMSFYPYLVLAGYVLFLIAGFNSIGSRKSTQILQNTKLLRAEINAIVICFIIGMLGTFLKLYQLFFIQELLTVDAYALRESQIYSAEFNTGALGLIIALTFPFSIISFLAMVYYKKYFGTEFVIFSGFFASVYILSSILKESRLPIALAISMFVIVWYFYQLRYGSFFYNNFQLKIYRSKLFKVPKLLAKKYFLIIAAVLLIAISFSTKVMINRLNYYNYRDVLKTWQMYHGTEVDEAFKEKVRMAPKSERNVLVSKYSLYHYFAHGVFEFNRLVTHLDDYNGVYYGKYQLDVYVKFFRFLGLETETKQEMDDALFKKGYYTTFWGPFYLDFGLFGIILCFFMGRYIQQTFNRAKEGNLFCVLMYSYISVNLLASFHVTFFGSSYMYVFNALLVFWLIRKFFKEIKISYRLVPGNAATTD